MSFMLEVLVKWYTQSYVTRLNTPACDALPGYNVRVHVRHAAKK